MPPLVPIEDVATHLSVSLSTVRAWVRQGTLPRQTYVKIGNTYRYDLDQILDHFSGRGPLEKSAKPVEDVSEQLEINFNNPDKDI